MRKVIKLLPLICLLSCKKETKTQRPPGSDGSNVEEVYRNLAKEYAIVKLEGISDAVMDTLYFSYTVYATVPDSATYRRSIVDKTAVEAFKYTFEQSKDKPGIWKHLWFAFDVQFISDRTDSVIRFQYPLKMSMFSF